MNFQRRPGGMQQLPGNQYSTGVGPGGVSVGGVRGGGAYAPTNPMSPPRQLPSRTMTFEGAAAAAPAPSYGGYGGGGAQSYGGGGQPQDMALQNQSPAWGGNTQSQYARTGGTFGNAQQGYTIGPNGVKYWGYDNVAIGGHSAGSSAPAHNPLTSANAVAAMGGYGGYGGYGGQQGNAGRGGVQAGGVRGGAPAAGAGGGAGGQTDIATLLQQYQDQANAENEGRYQEGRGIITNGQQSQLAQLQSGKDAQNAIAGGISNTNLVREQRRTSQDVASTRARLYGMGLAKTTGAIMAEQGVEDRGAEREAAASDEGKRLSLGIEGNYQNALQGQLSANRGQELNWIYNKDVQGPDVGLYANILSRAGANGQSNYGGYGGLAGGGVSFGGNGGGRRGGRGGGFGLSNRGPDPSSGYGTENGTGYGGQRYGGYGGYQTPDPIDLSGQVGGSSGGWDPSMNQGSNYSGDPLDLSSGGYTSGGGPYDYAGAITGGLSNDLQAAGGPGSGYTMDGDVLIDPTGKRWRMNAQGNVIPA